MKCPVCGDISLLMAERQGVEVDYCPECRGVWLDRGKLDKIVERSGEMAAAPAGTADARRDDHHDRHRDDHDDHGYGGSGSKKKKSGLFGDILGGLGG
jgi:uncharacterized protein